MNRLKEVKKLRAKAESLKLENAEILRKYNMQQLYSIYNGIGPDAFPNWLRDAISALHPSLAVVALIHDVEWHESDLSKETFAESNARFKRNGYAAAKAEVRLVRSPALHRDEPGKTLWQYLSDSRLVGMDQSL